MSDQDFEYFEDAETGVVTASVTAAIDAAEHLADTDQGAITLALSLAEIIDTARDSGDYGAYEKTSFGPMPTLHKVLTSLGLNPEGRDKLGISTGDDSEEW